MNFMNLLQKIEWREKKKNNKCADLKLNRWRTKLNAIQSATHFSAMFEIICMKPFGKKKKKKKIKRSHLYKSLNSTHASRQKDLHAEEEKEEAEKEKSYWMKRHFHSNWMRIGVVCIFRFGWSTMWTNIRFESKTAWLHTHKSEWSSRLVCYVNIDIWRI